jgi:hypothetical protein
MSWYYFVNRSTKRITVCPELNNISGYLRSTFIWPNYWSINDKIDIVADKNEIIRLVEEDSYFIDYKFW